MLRHVDINHIYLFSKQWVEVLLPGNITYSRAVFQEATQAGIYDIRKLNQSLASSS